MIKWIRDKVEEIIVTLLNRLIMPKDHTYPDEGE